MHYNIVMFVVLYINDVFNFSEFMGVARRADRI